METLEIFEKTKVRTLESDPQYFGGYLNMARLNIFNINNHIAGFFGLSKLKDDDLIQNSFLCDPKISRINWPHVFSKTKHLLTILKVFDTESLPYDERLTTVQIGKQFTLMNETLKIVFRELQQFRNDYSHYYSTVNGADKKVTISEDLAYFLNKNYERAISYTIDRFRNVFTEDDFVLASKMKLVEEDNKITVYGLVFLTAMFLEREQAFQFITKIKGLKGTQYSSFIATHEVLMAFCLKLPHDRFKSDDLKQADILDLINELNRCPENLWENLSEPDKQRFVPDFSEADKRKLEFFEYEEYSKFLSKGIRFRNRFTGFALKYIEYSGLLRKYKLMIDIGKLTLGSYSKLLNNEEVDRQIQGNVKAFGEVHDYLDEEKVLLKIENGHKTSGFTRYKPHYSFTNNKIGLLPKTSHSLILAAQDRKIGIKLKQPKPLAFLSANELVKIIILDYLDAGKPEKLIADFIEKNEQILDLNFIQEIKSNLNFNEFARRTHKKSVAPYKDSALEHLKWRKRELHKILTPHNITLEQIPSRILDYWLNVKTVDESRKAIEKISRIRLETRNRHKEIQKVRQENKQLLKPGVMASYLAKDIIDMLISEEKKKKITSFYYNQLQECLALFGNPGKKQLFLSIVINEPKLNERDGHPFLFKLDFNEINLTVDFYEKYLWEKGAREIPVIQRSGKAALINTSWITNTFYKDEWSEKDKKKITVISIPENQNLIPVTLRIKNRHSLEQWLSNKKDKPIDLPTDLFDEELFQHLSLLTGESQKLPDKKLKWNELLKIWWMNYRKDNVQDFYKYSREYNIYGEKVAFKPDSDDNYAVYYKKAFENVFKDKKAERKLERINKPRLPDIDPKQVERVFKKAISGNEKELRIIKEQDMACTLILEKLLNTEIKLNKINTWLNETTRVEQTVTAKLSYNQLKEEDNLINNTITRKIISERKGKDYTVLQRFVHDRRLPELFEYFSQDEIPLDCLKKELESYNKHKLEIQDAVFNLEKCLTEEHLEEITLLFTDDNGNRKYGTIQHKPYLIWLLKNGYIDEKTFCFMKMVRNCFFHNQFPQKATMELLIENWNDNCFAELIAEEFKGITVELIYSIQNRLSKSL